MTFKETFFSNLQSKMKKQVGLLGKHPGASRRGNVLGGVAIEGVGVGVVGILIE